MQISQAGVDFIKGWEKFSATPYQDTGGVWTLGYGHAGKGVNASTPPVTEEDAESLLRGDLVWVERCLNDSVTYPANQNQFDALASFAFNVGGPQFRESTLLALLNQGKVFPAADEFSHWVYCRGKKLDGLVNRRLAEESLFLKPVLIADNAKVPT